MSISQSKWEAKVRWSWRLFLPNTGQYQKWKLTIIVKTIFLYYYSYRECQMNMVIPKSAGCFQHYCHQMLGKLNKWLFSTIEKCQKIRVWHEVSCFSYRSSKLYPLAYFQFAFPDRFGVWKLYSSLCFSLILLLWPNSQPF